LGTQREGGGREGRYKGVRKEKGGNGEGEDTEEREGEKYGRWADGEKMTRNGR
jgi:hypothetical protein